MRAHAPRIKTSRLEAFKMRKIKEAEEEALKVVIKKEDTVVILRSHFSQLMHQIITYTTCILKVLLALKKAAHDAVGHEEKEVFDQNLIIPLFHKLCASSFYSLTLHDHARLQQEQ